LVTKPVSRTTRKKPIAAPAVKPAKPKPPKPAADEMLNDPPRQWAADAYSIAEFCKQHRISIPLFYKVRHQMPDTFNVGSRVLISREAAARWRAEREQAAHA
jgi:hypothetical protein